jgi:hypothetical protein
LLSLRLFIQLAPKSLSGFDAELADARRGNRAASDAAG